MHPKKLIRFALAVLTLAFLSLTSVAPVLAAADVVASATFDPTLTNPNSLNVGDTFKATISLSSASNQTVDAVGLYLTYDRTKVQVNSATALSGLDCVTGPSYNNTNGTITGDCAKLGGAAANFDVLEIVFQVLVTDTRFDLSFVECATPSSTSCFGAYSSATNQIATYNSATNTPLAVTLSSLSGTSRYVSPVLLAALLLAGLVGLWLGWPRQKPIGRTSMKAQGNLSSPPQGNVRPQLRRRRYLPPRITHEISLEVRAGSALGLGPFDDSFLFEDQ